MPRATDGNLRKKHIIRESSRRLRAAKNLKHPPGHEAGLDAAQEVQAPKPRTRPNGQPINGDVAGVQGEPSDRDCLGPVISVAISIDADALKRFVSNSVPSFNT